MNMIIFEIRILITLNLVSLAILLCVILRYIYVNYLNKLLQELKRARTTEEQQSLINKLINRRPPSVIERLFMLTYDCNSCELHGITFSNKNLSKFDFHGASLTQANFEGANLQNANLFEANLSGARLDGANLRGADLRNANIINANLMFTNLSGANLSGANLEQSYIYGVNLKGARLVQAKLPCVDKNSRLILPDGTLSSDVIDISQYVSMIHPDYLKTTERINEIRQEMGLIN